MPVVNLHLLHTLCFQKITSCLNGLPTSPPLAPPKNHEWIPKTFCFSFSVVMTVCVTFIPIKQNTSFTLTEIALLASHDKVRLPLQVYRLAKHPFLYLSCSIPCEETEHTSKPRQEEHLTHQCHPFFQAKYQNGGESK